MIGFKPRISGVGSDHSTNWVTATAPAFKFFCIFVWTHSGVQVLSTTDAGRKFQPLLMFKLR